MDYLYKYDESLKAYEKALELDPNMVSALQNKSNYYKIYLSYCIEMFIQI